MRRFITALLMILVLGGVSVSNAYGQDWLESLGRSAINRAKNRAKEKVEQKINEKVDQAVDDTFDAVTGQKKKEAEAELEKAAREQAEREQQLNDMAAQAQSQQDAQSAAASAKPDIKNMEQTYAKSDFVPGDDIIFEDNLDGEQVGEFPSKWDIVQGDAEIAKVNGETVIAMISESSWIMPLMKEPYNYLGDVFTIEFDVLAPYTQDEEASYAGYFIIRLQKADESYAPYSWHNFDVNWPALPVTESQKGNINYTWTTSSEDSRSGSAENVLLRDNNWHHFAYSFNKRALKFYVDGNRVANIPNAISTIGWVSFENYSGKTGQYVYMKNIRIAKGAVPLYDRMMSDGKFITYGITFDVGKSVIKPESMGEINRIVQLMNENPSLKFSVEGHTDSTGNATSNQKLSEARAAAIVDKLVELGIARNRLSSVGKGQNSPLADNSTDEGRAKNRRVEFVKQ